MSNLRIALVGYGRMGREIETIAPTRDIDVAARFDSHRRVDELSSAEFDVAIEFTSPLSVLDNIQSLVRLGVPMVVGTTGWLDRLDELRGIVDEHQGRLIYGSNFSVGVNIFFRIVSEAARLFNEQPDYDVAVHEIHHTGKADSPSGTALSIARILIENIERKRGILADTPHSRIPPDALHVTSQRLGATVGTHMATFDSEADTIELVHRAKNRSGFALGALLAARWIVGQEPGIYRFEELF
jgi:4-hydroxy-tetrahydrodipicolinate reductase